MAALATAAIAVMLAAAPVSAETVTVRMDNGYDFHPSYATIGRGDTIRWKNNSAFEDHDVRATAPNGYFKSPGGNGGLEPGDTYSRTFKSAGSFWYVCLNHASEGMQGTVVVPMSATEIDGGDRFRLTVASANLPSGSAYRHVIQVDAPGGGGFVDWKTTRKAVVNYTPGASGTYRFRSLVEKTSNGQRSSPSPTKTLSH